MELVQTTGFIILKLSQAKETIQKQSFFIGYASWVALTIQKQSFFIRRICFLGCINPCMPENLI